MSKIDLRLIKKLREETGVAIIRIREVLEEVGGDEKKALVILKKEGVEKAAKREGRETGQGKIFVYSHHTGKIVSVAELLCETDFVAKTDVFETLGKEQEFIKDPGKTISGLIKEAIAKTGENIRVGRVFRVELGK